MRHEDRHPDGEEPQCSHVNDRLVAARIDYSKHCEQKECRACAKRVTVSEIAAHLYAV